MTQKIVYTNHKSYLQSIPIKDRSSYRQKILLNKQIKGQQPVFYHKQYPNHGTFTYKDFKLHFGYLEQTTKPQAVIFFFHGMYCHGGTSGYLADVIASHVKNVNIYAVDFKNAGLSEGDCPGYYTVPELQDQAIKFVEFIQEKYSGLKTKPNLFIMGQSMGGLVTFKLCVNYPKKWAGAVMFAPALRDCKENIPFLKQLGRMMGFMCPTLKLVPQDYIGFTKYENFEHMKNEKGRYLGAHPPGTAYSFLKQMDMCQKLFEKMETPYFVIQGGIDMTVDLFAPIDLETKSKTNDKTTLYYKEMWHDILVEEQIKEIAPKVAEWIKKRV